jgi:dTDP-4-amino-4,6-dideoxygalactose transaminase
MSQLAIPFFGLQRQYRNLREEILEATDRVLQSGQLMSGPETQDFERWLANKNRSRYAVTCHSGTQALEIIAAYYKAKSYLHHDRTAEPTVLIPALTYVATANAWKKAGWNIHIVDTDYHGIVDMSKIPDNREWDAICMVGLYGAALPMLTDNLMRFSPVIEDGAQHWLSDSSTRCSVTAISFDPTKNLGNYGNGGAIVTDVESIAEFARGWCSNKLTGVNHPAATNSRMSEVDCAQLLVKTNYLDAWQARRRDIAAYWIDKFKGTTIRALIDDTNFDTHCFHKFVIDIDNRDLVQEKLVEKKIETKVHYATPIQDIPEYQHFPGPDMLSTSSALSRRCLSLPLYPELSDDEVECIAKQVIYCVS